MTFNKLAEIFSNLDPGTRDLPFVFPLMDKDGKVTGFQTASDNIIHLAAMRPIVDGNIGNEGTVVVVGPNKFKLEDHVAEDKIMYRS